MRTLFIVALLLVQTTQAPERYPGQATHQPPPEGWMCRPQNYEMTVPAEHVCNCERMCDSDTGKIIEDKKCETWCYPKSCLCDMSNKQACK